MTKNLTSKLITVVVVLALIGMALPPAAYAASANTLPQAGTNGFIAPVSARDSNAKPVSTVSQLRAMANGGNYYLANDIDLKNYNGGVWVPLTVAVKLDGQGYKITNLNIPESSKTQYAGLFGYIDSKLNLIVKNLGVHIKAEGEVCASDRDHAISGIIYGNFAGGIVACVYGRDCSFSISNCYVKGMVACSTKALNSGAYAGGLVGETNGIINSFQIVNCYTTGEVRVDVREGSDAWSSAGGLAGALSNSSYCDREVAPCNITNCYSSCNVDLRSASSNSSSVGGLVAESTKGTISNSFSTGSITANAASIMAGGFVGSAYYTVMNHCTASGSVSAVAPGTGEYRGDVDAGGLVGYAGCSSQPIKADGCFALGSVDAVAQSNSTTDCTTCAIAGGLIGRPGNSTITNSYAMGSVNAVATSSMYDNAIAGGVAGTVYEKGTISKCYSAGAVIATANGAADRAGGIAGEVHDGGKVADCFYDRPNSGAAQAVGDNVWLAPDAGKTTEQMKSANTYASWDFTTAWWMNGSRNLGYPYLQWQFPCSSISSAASAGFDSVKVAWSAVPGAAGYELYRAAPGGAYEMAASQTKTAFTDTALMSGRTYSYKVRAFYTDGSTTAYDPFSSVKSATPIPATPSISVASAGYISVKVAWTPVPGANGYEVFRSTSSSGTYVLARTASSAEESFTNTGLGSGKTYYYKVRAYHLVNGVKIYSSYSPVKSVKPVPAAPAPIKASAASYNTIKLTWGKVAGVTKYEVYRATSKSGAYKRLTSTASVSYTNTAVNTGTTYFYKVRAYRLVSGKKVFGPYSAAVSAKTILPIPTSVKAARASSSSIRITWKKVPGATKYEVWRSMSQTGTYARITTTASAYYSNTKLVAGKYYYYKVRAYRLVGSTKVYSGFSGVVFAKP